MKANEVSRPIISFAALSWERRASLAGAELAHARCDTIRLKLLKIGPVVRVTVRRVWFSLAESYPYREPFARVYWRLCEWSRPPPALA